MERPPRKLLDQVRDAIQRIHYSIRTEATCIDWIRRHILFHGKVSASTQNQALCALVFLYKHVLNV